MPYAEGNEDEDDVRALVQRFSASGAQVLFDATVDPDDGLDGWERGDPDVTLVLDVFAG